MKFWDSSAIVPLLASEPATHQLMQVYKKDPFISVWWATPIECTAAVARMERGGNLNIIQITESLERLRKLSSSWQEVQPTNLLKEQAIRLLRVHSLRAADAAQLAAAWILSEHRPSTLDFVCLDSKLTLAAQREGFNLIT